MRETNFAERLDVMARAGAPHRADEVAKAVNGDDRRVVERRDEERGRKMRPMMFDVVQRGLQFVQLERITNLRSQVRDFRPTRQPAPDGADRGPLRQDERRALPQSRVGVAIDGDVIDVVDPHPRLLEAILDGQRGKPRPMLDATESLLLRGRHEPAVDHDGRRGVGVVCVNP